VERRVTLLAIDPGETVGWAIYDGPRKVDGGQTDWGQFPDLLAQALEVGWAPDVSAVPGCPESWFEVSEIVIEDFVIYPPDVGPGPPPYWDQVITARVIGAIAWIAEAAHVPVHYQGAKIKSDALASAAAEDFARPLHENRHENDATMHAVYFTSRLAAASPEQRERRTARRWGEK
jgi:hypothetical protein